MWCACDQRIYHSAIPGVVGVVCVSLPWQQPLITSSSFHPFTTNTTHRQLAVPFLFSTTTPPHHHTTTKPWHKSSPPTNKRPSSSRFVYCMRVGWWVVCVRSGGEVG